ncbi:FkbM family methyltransferase [Flammeovirgaceae bacterium SG7u.111]|nr:FkbM family methyltransferase [Flammeovirgaceae bacterium SG7u.132]WPO34978.1 FkbM family methyltransferase [Flammeovirgaceae bacterium SG7u.111]
MKATSLIYQLFTGFYKIIPFKKQVCSLLRKIPFKENFYTDLKFRAPFQVKINEQSFSLFHWESTIENEIFWHGLGNTWESETIFVWKKICPHVNIILDIGANTGVYSLMAKAINPSVNIFAFEPSDLVYNKLTFNNKMNNFDIHCINKGVSNISDSLTFYDVEGTHQTSASLEPAKLKDLPSFKGKIREYQISTITIDEFIRDNNLEKVDLIKIDVELHEPQILEGFSTYLTLYYPYIIIEVLTTEVAKKLNKIITKTEYEIFNIEHNKLTKTDKLTPIGCYNYLLAHPSKKVTSLFN